MSVSEVFQVALVVATVVLSIVATYLLVAFALDLGPFSDTADDPFPEETDPDTRLWAALTEAGRAIESMPHDERFDRVDDALERLGLHPQDGQARNFLVGVFVDAHARRLAAEENHHE